MLEKFSIGYLCYIPTLHVVGKTVLCQGDAWSNLFVAELQHEDAMRHAQRRIADLLHKADAVDKTEYERVVMALKAAEGRLSSLEGDAARLQPLADQLEPLQAKVARLEVIQLACIRM